MTIWKQLAVGVSLVACGSPERAPSKPVPVVDDVSARTAKLDERCTSHYNARDWDQLRTCYAADVVQDEPGTGKPWIGIDDAVDHLKLFVTSFPDNTVTPELTLVAGNHTASIVLLRGTNTGPFPGAGGPTNKPIGLSMVHVVDLDATGKIKTEWILYDTITMLSQLGLVPIPARGRIEAPAPAHVVLARNDAREQQNLTSYRAAAEAFDAHDLERVRAGFTDDLVWTEPSRGPDMSKAAAVGEAAELWRAFSDLRRTTKTAWAAGDYVVATGTMTGTNDGPLPAFGLDKTGKQVDVTYVEIAHFVDGKRDRSWLFYNGIVVASQLGLL